MTADTRWSRIGFPDAIRRRRKARTAEQLGADSPSGRFTNEKVRTREYRPKQGRSLPGRNLDLNYATLQAAFAEVGLYAKAVRILPDDALSKPLIFPDLDEGAEEGIRERMAELDLTDKLRRAAYFARAYGDGYLYLNDRRDQAGEFEGPLESIHVLTGWQVVPDNEAVSRDLVSQDFDQPREYVALNGNSAFNIHESRLLRITNTPPPPGGWAESEEITVTDQPLRKLNRSYCGLSLLQTILTVLMSGIEGRDSAAFLLKAPSKTVIGVQDFARKLQDPDTSNQLEEVAANLAGINSEHDVFFRDAADTTQQISVSLAGLTDVLMSFRKELGEILDIPESRFLGVEPAGLNSTGMASTRRYNSLVGNYQATNLDPVLARVFNILGTEGLPDIRWRWPLWLEESDFERVERQGKQIDNLAQFMDIREQLGEIDQNMVDALAEAMLASLVNQG